MGTGLPKSGASSAVVLKAVREVREQDGDRKLRDWNRHTFLYTFHVSDELKQAAQSAYLESFGTDALSAHTFPSVKKFRSGVIDYAKSILSAGERAVGAFTTGGTESIILSMKCARDWARQHKPQVTHPQVICPVSAHPAFNKAAELLGFDVLRLPIGADLRADVAATEAAVSERTIGIVGSAPNYWYGIVDPIAELAALADRRGLWMHVDACVGGFLAPFVKKLGHDVPDFDFSVPGVCSISADLHKYGYTPKGASIAMFRDRADAHNLFQWKDQYADYVTPALAGTRGGGIFAAAWTVMTMLGEEGYLKAAAAVMKSAHAVRAAVEGTPDLFVPGNPQLGILTVGSRTLDIAAVASGLAGRGWLPNVFADPPLLHLRFAPAHTEVIDEFIGDLVDAVREVREGTQQATIRRGVYTDL